VAWNKVCSPIEEGGLGVKHIGKFNTILLAKWLWRLGTEEEGVWRDITMSRYGSWWEMIGSMSVRKASSWWRYLSKIGDSVDQHNWFLNRIAWEWVMERRLDSRMIFGSVVFRSKRDFLDFIHFYWKKTLWSVKWENGQLLGGMMYSYGS